jgi:radical SAM superfamily enzyme YgiQ (UPF0313 family)
MRHALIVSLDIIRPGEPGTSLSTASLLAFLKSSLGYGERFTVEHLAVNLMSHERETEIETVLEAVLAREPRRFQVIAIACYVWSERITRGLLPALRRCGFRGTIVLGGPQISYSCRDELSSFYPDADVFVTGYGEASLHRAIISGAGTSPAILEEDVDFATLPSPYLSGVLEVAPGQERVRMETRRGCPFRCSFCAHRDLKKKTVHERPKDRVRDELAWLAERGVKKVNFLDPVFNQGNEYLNLLDYMVGTGFRPEVSFQSRFELIRGDDGARFVDLARRLNATLEFGLQTANPGEAKTVDRGNNIERVRSAMDTLNQSGVPYEVSLIYGLPGQTLQSFADSVLFLRDNGCERIVAFPLMLLRGTDLYAQKAKWGFKERSEGRFGIPVVYESHSFSEAEWHQMGEIANDLGAHERV